MRQSVFALLQVDISTLDFLFQKTSATVSNAIVLLYDVNVLHLTPCVSFNE